MDEEESVPGAHGTPVCQFYKRKRCQREERCNFVHDTNRTKKSQVTFDQTDGAGLEQPVQESAAAGVGVGESGSQAGEEARGADVVDARGEREQEKNAEEEEEKQVEAGQERVEEQETEAKQQEEQETQDQELPDRQQQAQQEVHEQEQTEITEQQEEQVHQEQEQLQKQSEQDSELEKETQLQDQPEDKRDDNKDEKRDEELRNQEEQGGAVEIEQVSEKDVPLPEHEQVAKQTQEDAQHEEVGPNLPPEEVASVPQSETAETATLPQNDDLPSSSGTTENPGTGENLTEEPASNHDATKTSVADSESRETNSHQEAEPKSTDSGAKGDKTPTSEEGPGVNATSCSSIETADNDLKESGANSKADSVSTRSETASTRCVTGVADVTSGKTIRRDSMGFEEFDDYFTESENDGTGDSSILDQSTASSQATVATTSTAANSLSEGQSQHFAKKSKAPPAPQEDESTKGKFAKKINKDEGREAAKRTEDSNQDEADVVALTEECEEGETIESIQNFIASTPVATKKSGVQNENSFNNEPEQTPIAATKAKKVVDESIYDLDIDGESDEGGNLKETPVLTPRKTPSLRSTRTIRKDELAEKDLVTKIGNNTYFYAGGNKRNNESAEMSDEEDSSLYLVHRADDSDLMSDSGRPSGPGSGKSYMQGRKQHRTDYVYGAKSTSSKARRCGECEGCNRADCGKCVACKDKPKFGGRGLKKQACVYRVCTWKHPSGRKGGGSTSTSKSKGRGTVQRSGTLVPRQLVAPSPRNATKKATETPQKAASGEKTNEEELSASATTASNAKRRRSRQKIPVIAPSGSEEIDDDSLKPGSRVRKGSDEYVVVMSGANTGLCGKYWADADNLPPRRSRRSVENQRLEEENSSGVTPKKRKNEEEENAKRSSKRDSKKQEVEISDTAEMMLEASKPPKKRAIVSEDDSQSASPSKRTRKVPDSDQAEVTVVSTEEQHLTSVPNSQPEENILERAKRAIDEATISQNRNGESVSSEANTNNSVVGPSSGVENDHRQETTTNGVVEMECFAPYDDHKWVNIGRKEDGMPADAVQYVRALRPPYHLLSFIRIQGNSMKGFSCTDKNTMVFVVLEGEVNVVLHTTQFVAKKGDSFYIPAKNFYNLINQREEKAELFLIQFQYDGPVPMIPATSQSGQPKTTA